MEKIELPESYDEFLEREAERIIKTYADRLKNAVSVYDETQRILEEENYPHPESKELLPAKVMEIVRSKGKKKTLEESKKAADSMSKYAKESRGSGIYAQNEWEKERERKINERKGSVPTATEETEDLE